MKLDPELIRKILIAYEELPFGGDSNIEIDGYTSDQILYHQEILEEAGYIKAIIETYTNGIVDITPIRLTYQGHEFLNASLDDDRWDKVKNIMSKSGGFVMKVAESLLISYLREQLHLS